MKNYVHKGCMMGSEIMDICKYLDQILTGVTSSLVQDIVKVNEKIITSRAMVLGNPFPELLRC